MEIAAMRTLYDRHERRQASYPLYSREETERTVRMIGPPGGHSVVIWSSLSEGDAEAAIDAEIARFGELSRPFEWKAYSHDAPPDLASRLAARGFTIGGEERIMVLDARSPEADSLVRRGESRPGLRVAKVRDADTLERAKDAQRAIWTEEKDEAWLDALEARVASFPDYTSVYVAFADGIPVASAWVDFPAGSPFASLWGAGTVEAYRGRGAYSALVSARVAEARARGYRYLTVDAGSMSAPILEPRGFVEIAKSWACDYEHMVKNNH
jgi:GNAT superfamily N-acetyltransferase